MHEGASIRLDKWLWHARFCKTRSIAARFVESGAVRVNAVRVLKPAAPVRIGDGVTLRQGQTVRVLRVRGIGWRRGPAVEARELYEDVSTAEPAAPPLEPPRGADT